jgi:glutathione S-transferase
MKKSLIGHIRDLDARFNSEAQLWLCATEHPSAADFAAYGMIDRLAGETGDSGFGIPVPWLWDEAGAPKLQAWHARMQQKYPIKFRGKTGACKVWAESSS